MADNVTKSVTYKYIEIFHERSSASGLTEIWNIYSVSSGDILGTIKWYAPWMQYCFWSDDKVVWNKTCLNDVVDFIGKEMKKRRDRKR